ncbi:hypothetical protein ABZX95_39155 [Streptomyces sp. NPDC004232]|uniref:hypothetical protein n=1 Tax=unclassified Streptomyces TaxID=2593676 RepID=UPI001D81384D|nr:hypothetical protein [Streptomyces sp. tea 10]
MSGVDGVNDNADLERTLVPDATRPRITPAAELRGRRRLSAAPCRRVSPVR